MNRALRTGWPERVTSVTSTVPRAMVTSTRRPAFVATMSKPRVAPPTSTRISTLSPLMMVRPYRSPGPSRISTVPLDDGEDRLAVAGHLGRADAGDREQLRDGGRPAFRDVAERPVVEDHVGGEAPLPRLVTAPVLQRHEQRRTRSGARGASRRRGPGNGGTGWLDLVEEGRRREASPRTVIPGGGPGQEQVAPCPRDPDVEQAALLRLVLRGLGEGER